MVIFFDKQTDVTKEKHLIRLKTSIKAVRYLLHQGLAFRGHDESDESTNKGNFKELVQLLAEENDKVKKFVSKAPKNNKMIAPEIQRDIANCFAAVRLPKIIMLSSIVHKYELSTNYHFLADHSKIYH